MKKNGFLILGVTVLILSLSFVFTGCGGNGSPAGGNGNGNGNGYENGGNKNQFLKPEERSAALREEIVRLNALAPELMEGRTPHQVYVHKSRYLMGFANTQIGTGMSLRKTVTFDEDRVPQISLDDLSYNFGNPLQFLDFTVPPLGIDNETATNGIGGGGGVIKRRGHTVTATNANTTHQSLVQVSTIQGQEIDTLEP